MKLNNIIAILATSSMIYTNATVAAPGGGGGGGGPLATEILPPNLKCDSNNDGKTVTISWDAGSPNSQHFAYTIALNHTGNTWAYTVSNGPGNQKALSHWVLGIPSCENHDTSSTNPPIDDWGIDPTTGVNGAKWNTPSGVSDTGTLFTLELDKLYAETEVNFAAKSSTFYGKCKIIGPDCTAMKVDLLEFTAEATDSGTKVEFTTGYEEDIAAFNLYRGTLRVGAECTANPGDYSNLTLIDTIPSGQPYYQVDDVLTVGTDAICYGLTTINDKGQLVDILGAVPRQ